MDYVSEEPVTEPFIERFRYKYNELQKEIFDENKTMFLIQLKQLMRNGISIIYPNQETIARKVVNAFKNRKITNCMIISKTQSGKTGSMCALIKLYLEDPSNPIPIKNIYIITGLSSCEWKEQTGERMPAIIRDRVFHRHELPVTFVDEIKSKNNILIIMDEIQVAAQIKQTIKSAFDKAGLSNKTIRYEKDIKILEYTATPDGVIYDLMNCESSMKIIAEAGNGYVSSYDLLQQGRVKQYKNLCGYAISQYLEDLDKTKKYTELSQSSKRIDKFINYHVRNDIMCNNEEYDEASFLKYMDTFNLHKYKELFDISDLKKLYDDKKKIFKNIQEIKCVTEKYDRPLYHIIRTKTGTNQELTINNFKNMFDKDIYNFITYDVESEIEDINKILMHQPNKHTFIFIKEMLRCSKTLKKQHLGILYERYTSKQGDSTIMQGLLGRITGYDGNPNNICFTHMDTIERYELLWKSDFERTDITWNSLTTKSRGGETGSKGTYQVDDDDSVESADIPEIKEPIIKRYKTQEEVMDYFNKVIKVRQGGRGPEQRKPNEKGFYITTIRSKTDICSFDEIYNERKFGLTNDTYRLYPCYENITDPSTLEFWFIHY
jgi:hypothetical protein